MKRLLLLLGIACACVPHKEVEIDPYTPVSSMQESNRLFFRNVRAAYYDREEVADTKMEVFRLKERIEENVPDIRVKQVQHVVLGKAFAMLEPAQLLENVEQLTVCWEDTATQKKGLYRLQVASTPPDHYTFASRLYQSIQRKHLLRVVHQADTLPLWPNPDMREPFRKSMVDFYRVVGVL